MRNANKEITKKHDHSLTNLLKGTLFSLVMLAPIFSIAVRCGYVMFNKNAYESYYGETINESKEVNISLNNLQPNNSYIFQNSEFLSTNSTDRNNFIVNDLNINNTDLSDYHTLRFFGTNNGGFFIQAIETDLTTRGFSAYDTLLRITFTYLSRDTNNQETILNSNLFKTEYNNYSYLDNAFTYGISNLKNETVFNWTQNTALYQPINAMCTGLGITEEAIAIMLTYWALMTAIYIIFDIVIVLFTKLTHLLN